MKHFALAIIGLQFTACWGAVRGAVRGAADEENEGRALKGEPPKSTNFTVALWADMPYSGRTTGVFNQTVGTNYGENSVDNPGTYYKRLRACINGETGNICNTTAPPSFVWFAGDMNSGATPCTQFYYDRFEGFVDSFLAPSLLVLGDNEWTDCHKTKTGEPHDPFVAHKYVQTRYFDQGGRSIYGVGQIQTTNGGFQYPDFQRWKKNGITFVGVTVVGSNNGLYDGLPQGLACASSLQVFDPGCIRSTAEWTERDAAANQFLKDSFAEAKRAKSKGVMIMIQADLWKGQNSPNCSAPIPYIPTGLVNFYATLMEQVTTFKGQVALVHGDSHVFKLCNDSPQTAMPLPGYGYVPNFVDLQVPGSVNIGYVTATIDAATPKVFSFKNFYFTPPPYVDN